MLTKYNVNIIKLEITRYNPILVNERLIEPKRSKLIKSLIVNWSRGLALLPSKTKEFNGIIFEKLLDKDIVKIKR